MQTNKIVPLETCKNSRAYFSITNSLDTLMLTECTCALNVNASMQVDYSLTLYASTFTLVILPFNSSETSAL